MQQSSSNRQPTLWFKAKRYGYGWYPVTWQGWAIVVLYIGGLLSEVMLVNSSANPEDSNFLINFFPRVLVLTVFLIVICRAKGEPAKWRWGSSVDEK